MVVGKAFFFGFSKNGVFNLGVCFFFSDLENSHFQFLSFFGFSEIDLSFSFLFLRSLTVLWFFFRFSKTSFFFLRFFRYFLFYGVFLSFFGIFKNCIFNWIFFSRFPEIYIFLIFICFQDLKRAIFNFGGFSSFLRNSPF